MLSERAVKEQAESRGAVFVNMAPCKTLAPLASKTTRVAEEEIEEGAWCVLSARLCEVARVAEGSCALNEAERRAVAVFEL
jgi:hypothetical protein